MSLLRSTPRKSKHDNYTTPAWAVRSLLEVENFNGTILEPACGIGVMARTLIQAKGSMAVYYQDIRGGLFQDNPAVDFLQDGFELGPVTNVITNPPFKVASQFVDKALEVTKEKVAMLLRLPFLEGSRRFKKFKAWPLVRVRVFSSRVSAWPEGTPGIDPQTGDPFPGTELADGPGGTAPYAWFIFDKSFPPGIAPTLHWFPPREKVRRP